MPIDDDALLAIIAVCLKKKEIEEQKKRTKRLWVKEYSNEKRDEYTYQHLLEELKTAPQNDFRHFFISDASIYEELLNMIGPLIKKQDTLMRVAIPVGLRLFTTLRFLATGYHFENMRSSTISTASVSKIVLETCEAIISRLKDYIKLPQNRDEWKAVSNGFSEKWDFPNCLGAVNGKHIGIIKPTGTHALYYNYKKFFSVVLIGVVNANYEFIAVDVDINGCKSGHEDFRHTSIGNAVYGSGMNIPSSNLLSSGGRELPYVFVGDDGFQLSKRLLKTIPGNFLTEDKLIYNYHISQVNQVIENTFGTLAWQFGVLQKPLSLVPEKVKTIVLACCYLYNYFKRKTAPHLWDGIFDRQNTEDGTMIKGLWREYPELTSLQPHTAENATREAEKVREQFVDLFSKERKV